MHIKSFKDWLINIKEFEKDIVNTAILNAKKIEKYYGNLDENYNNNKLESIIEELNNDNHKIPIKGKYNNDTETLKTTLILYLQFKNNPVLDQILHSEDIDPDSHDGSYELVREVVRAYSTIDLDSLTVEDLDMIYSMTLGSWKIGVSPRKERINKSNLLPIDKKRITSLLDEIIKKAKNNQYTNTEGGKDWSIGMFGSGLMTFKGKSDVNDAKIFISLLIKIQDFENESKILDISKDVFKNDIGGIQAGAASMMLHCLKPRVFPIINNKVSKSIVVLEGMDVVLNNGSKLTNYIENTKILITFRDKYCKFKNFRVLDREIWKAQELLKDPEWLIIDYTPSISKKKWIELLKDNTIFTEDNLKIMKRMKDNNGMGTCTELADKYGKSKNFYLSNSVHLAKRIYKHIDSAIMPTDSENSKWLPILYIDKYADKEADEVFTWELRDELNEALDEIDLSYIPLYDNQNIKTEYWWLNASPDIWSYSDIEIGEVESYTLYNENQNKRRIHQNFLDAKVGDKIIGYETSPTKKIVALGEIVEENDGEKIHFKKTEDIYDSVDFDELRNYPELKEMEFLKSPQGSFFSLTESEYDFIINIIKSDKVEKKIVDFSLPINLDSLYFEDKDTLKKQISIALKSGKSIILIGPPGTGKSKLAKSITESYKVESKMVTAMSDWSSYDTIGGYKPNNEGTLYFEDGIFLSSLKNKNGNNINKWLIIDEINRADIDKAFGPFFSALSGDDVELGLKDDSGNNIELLLEKNLEYGVDNKGKHNQYIIPKDWRIIGTMNTFDKTSLYEMSYAFMRRFAFIPVAIPKRIDSDVVRTLSNIWESELAEKQYENISVLWNTINKYRKIGPALIEDIVSFIKLDQDYTSSILIYILPQLEGLFDDKLIKFYKDIDKLDFINDKERLKTSIEDFFNISLGED